MKKQLVFFILGFILLFVIGGMTEIGINREQAFILEEKDSIIHLADALGARTMEEDTVSFLTSGNTTIIQKMNVMNKDGDLVAIIYTGETTGRKPGLQVAFAINVTTHHIIGMRIVASNETPDYEGRLYSSDTFFDQFLDKDMTTVSFNVEIVSGVTLTSTGIQQIMQLVRKQYDQDTSFTAPSEIVLVSKGQDMGNLEHFQYEFLIGEETLTAVVNQSYTLVSISNPAFQTLVLATIDRNPVTDFIRSATLAEGTWTIVIQSKGYTGIFVSTATVDDTTDAILSFSSNISNETYDSDYNDGYTGGSFQPVYDAVISGADLSIVTGATYTYYGVLSARNLLYSLLEGGLGA